MSTKKFYPEKGPSEPKGQKDTDGHETKNTGGMPCRRYLLGGIQRRRYFLGGIQIWRYFLGIVEVLAVLRVGGINSAEGNINN